MENINEIIGQNLLKLRKQKKLTQLELADKFNYSDKSISKWEKGESLPSIEVLHELAKFYQVSLDSLVSNEDIVSAPKKTSEEVKKLYPTSLVITLLAVSAVWLCATILYVCLRLTLGVSYVYCFMWAVPLSCIVMIVFNAVWGHYRYLFPILTVLLWSALACTHLQILEFGLDIWPIHFLGIPLQIAIILWGALIFGPRRRKKKLEKKHAENQKDDISSSNQTENTIENNQ